MRELWETGYMHNRVKNDYFIIFSEKPYYKIGNMEKIGFGIVFLMLMLLVIVLAGNGLLELEQMLLLSLEFLIL